MRLKVVCDSNAEVRRAMQQQYGDVRVEAQYEAVLKDSEVEAVVLAVPAIRHFSAAKAALTAGKHVYVEKPMTLDAAEAEELVDVTQQRGRVLMVGHLLEYHPAVEMLKGLIEAGSWERSTTCIRSG